VKPDMRITAPDLGRDRRHRPGENEQIVRVVVLRGNRVTGSYLRKKFFQALQSCKLYRPAGAPGQTSS